MRSVFRRRPFPLGTVLAFAGFTAFSVSDMFSKLLAGRLGPYEVAFSGGVFGLLLLPVVKTREESWRDLFPRHHWGIWLLRALSVFLATALSVEAFMLLPMAEAMALMFLCPFVTNVLSVLVLHQPVRRSSWLATLIGFIGVLIVLRPGMRTIGVGELCALGVAVVLAVNVISFKMGEGREKPLTVYSATLAGPLVGNGLLMLPSFQWPTGLPVWGDLFGYGFLMAGGQLCLMQASARIPSSRVALMQYSQMLWTVLFSLLIFHDHLDHWTILGIAIILLSGGVEGAPRRPNPNPNPLLENAVAANAAMQGVSLPGTEHDPVL
ncbi:DMT family transporter [Oecophyllibacter saccharovorans]|uniref:DMT family transporter n=1 Tax=Oecophyllibacter saccharovorans TaxID=2558360 RepID=A0A506UM10_9PROT|nr:DMT family transporter [Oecophyllibacter saccharovorans]TPW34223.1 DMT family transporter [Oecophyllibacter saccharovorans]